MTLLQLITHLKEVYVEAGNCDCLIIRPEPNDTYLAHLDLEDLKVDPEAKTITFT